MFFVFFFWGGAGNMIMLQGIWREGEASDHVDLAQMVIVVWGREEGFTVSVERSEKEHHKVSAPVVYTS